VAAAAGRIVQMRDGRIEDGGAAPAGVSMTRSLAAG
jgi:hypothetical protein